MLTFNKMCFLEVLMMVLVVLSWSGYISFCSHHIDLFFLGSSQSHFMGLRGIKIKINRNAGKKVQENEKILGEMSLFYIYIHILFIFPDLSGFFLSLVERWI